MGSRGVREHSHRERRKRSKTDPFCLYPPPLLLRPFSYVFAQELFVVVAPIE